eukprot:TRINITY_DN778228_c0_g1_i1.p1 TRINITY_DN778228_c0_g1~~TRINITY_DN778228_c0_g1_i1.p1  ORF type:complete len:332 (-),score=64.48 TRINITY_DN778228_c0_g1_i1:302-1297(-)
MSAVDDNSVKILLFGAKGSGKTSLLKVVFERLSPHETLFLEETISLRIHESNSNPFTRFQVWDFPGGYGQDYCFEDISYEGRTITEEGIFKGAGVLVYLVDAQNEPRDALARLHYTVSRAIQQNPGILVEVFIHKADGELLSEIPKTQYLTDMESQVVGELEEDGIEASINFHLTSIYDHSVFAVMSSVVQKMIPQFDTLENLLGMLVANTKIESCFLFDSYSKIYIVNDSRMLDMTAFELCSDIIDVSKDVSDIYGRGDHTSSEHMGSGNSTIEVSGGRYGGMVIHLRDVGNNLALVSIFRQENFKKQSRVDHNIDCFKKAVTDIIAASC